MQRRFLDVIAIIGIETAACDRPKLTSREGETSKIQVQPPRDVFKDTSTDLSQDADNGKSLILPFFWLKVVG